MLAFLKYRTLLVTTVTIFVFVFTSILATSNIFAVSQDQCYASGGHCKYDACTAPAVKVDTCDYGFLSVNCCRSGPPVTSSSNGTIPDTNCPVDATYVALTDSCIAVADFNNFLFNLLIFAGVLVSIFRATMGFFLFLTAEGSPDKLQNGREALTQAIVGLVIVIGGWVFIQLFESLLPQVWSVVLTG